MNLQKIAMPLIIATAAVIMGTSTCKAADTTSLENELQAKVKEIYDVRALAIITGADPGPALAYFDTTAELGRWALSHEQTRLNFIQSWAEKRGVRFTEATPSLHIPWSRVQEDTAEFIVSQTLQLGYVYPNDPTVNRFGIGTRHWIKLARKDGKWLIRQDFYTDGLYEDAKAPDPTPADGNASIEPVEQSASIKNDSHAVLDREGAARYADEYAGLAWGAGNDHNYNPRYGNLNDKGGDCTNFVSQCLGDKSGGKLPMDGAWYYRHDREGGSGSLAWVQAEAFAEWLSYSGRGQRIAWGTFPEMNQPDAKFSCGAVRELQKGDVIGYEENGYIEHFAIVVGTDSKGYPVVNAHTVDRYHSPWDMGCDKTTVFHLFRINDASLIR